MRTLLAYLMAQSRLAMVGAGIAAAVLLCGCSVSPTVGALAEVSPAAQSQNAVDLAAQYAQLASQGGRVFKLRPDLSAVRIYAFRAGPAAKFAHNHVLSAPEFDGFFYMPQADPSQSRFDLVFRLDRLAMDVPAHRAEAGPAFAKLLSDTDIEATREHMLGAGNLQADRYPYVRIHSLNISGESPKFSVRLSLEMHGQTREMWVPLTVTGLPEAIHASGSFVVRQTDFGVKPYAVLGGLISVQDELIVDFSLVGE